MQTESPPSPSVERAYYSASIEAFLLAPDAEILAALNHATGYSVEGEQRQAWEIQLELLRDVLRCLDCGVDSGLAFEFSIPRLGRRIDVALLIDGILFVVEFKVGSSSFDRGDLEQVWDYALDLKNFHESSHNLVVAPVLVATDAHIDDCPLAGAADKVLRPIEANSKSLVSVFERVLSAFPGSGMSWKDWERGQYRPTPTIIEAAKALFARHSVSELARSDAGAKNLARTSVAVGELIDAARATGAKVICFVTGVPGAGKTLVGLDVATKRIDKRSDTHAVYLSGNGPLVAVLSEALTRDHLHRELKKGIVIRKGQARQKVEAFIQNVHHFRDDCLKDERPPIEHVAIFDEAQRAWNLQKTIDFMARRKKRLDFNRSEPEFLISCLERHHDWAVVVCLVGEGQEINTGEAGIAEWLLAIEEKFKSWQIHASAHLRDESATKAALERLADRKRIVYNEALHLEVSLRSFRAENLSHFINCLLELDKPGAQEAYRKFCARYPLFLTRDVNEARSWLRDRARGSERYGIVVSSQAQRLKPHAIDVRAPTDPVHWFLDGREDTRSSFYLEDAATEFDVQGLELDWTCVVWDADFRYSTDGWRHHSFSGDRWKNVNQPQRRAYLKNAYRVLLTRARQGMVVVVPQGSEKDATRDPSFYDGTFEYFRSLGLPVL